MQQKSVKRRGEGASRDTGGAEMLNACALAQRLGAWTVSQWRAGTGEDVAAGVEATLRQQKMARKQLAVQK